MNGQVFVEEGKQRFFRENLKLGEGGKEGRDNDIVREMFERTGASVMGKRMFDASEQMWPEAAGADNPVRPGHSKLDPCDDISRRRTFQRIWNR